GARSELCRDVLTVAKTLEPHPLAPVAAKVPVVGETPDDAEQSLGIILGAAPQEGSLHVLPLRVQSFDPLVHARSIHLSAPALGEGAEPVAVAPTHAVILARRRKL